MTHKLDTVINRKGTNSTKWEFMYADDGLAERVMGDDMFAPDEVLPLWVADMDFQSPQPVIDALVARAQHGMYGYTSAQAGYFEAISNWMRRRHQWHVEPEWIMTTPGIVPTLNFIVQTFTNHGDGVLIQTPVYHPFYYAAERNGRFVVKNPMKLENGRYEIDFDDLDKKLADPKTKLFVLCSPHNPVGRVWTAAELLRMAQLCVTHNVLLISDEIHHDLIFSWGNFTTIANAAPDFMDHVIVTTAPSKTFNIPGLKSANAIVPNRIIREKLQAELVKHGLYGMNPFGIVGATAAYNHGDEWLAETMGYIEANYHFLCDYFAEHLPQVTVIKPQGTYLIWVDFRAFGLNDQTLYNKILHEGKVNLNNGGKFGEEGDGFVRFNIGCPRRILEEALKRIVGCFEKG